MAPLALVAQVRFSTIAFFRSVAGENHFNEKPTFRPSETVSVNTSALERSRWRGGRFACYAPHVMLQRKTFNFDSRFSLIFLSQAKSIDCKRKKIQFP